MHPDSTVLLLLIELFQCLQVIRIHPYLYGFYVVYTDIRKLRAIIRKHDLGIRLRICCWWI